MGKRLDDFTVDVSAGLDRIDARLAGVEAALVDHGERLARIERAAAASEPARYVIHAASP